MLIKKMHSATAKRIAQWKQKTRRIPTSNKANQLGPRQWWLISVSLEVIAN